LRSPCCCRFSRLDAQRALADLSTAGAQRIVDAGHNMHTEAPDVVVQAIRDVIAMSRRKPSGYSGGAHVI
jgi:pimeloyl-ACP methyl ester carboxylesterase